jgi:hypothetical protein
MTRPTIRLGDTGFHVTTVQTCLQLTPIDGDFGSITENGVKAYQHDCRLTADGVVGPQTWEQLEKDFNLPPWPPANLPPIDDTLIGQICQIAMDSAIAVYSWEGRGYAPPGYTKGMAVAFSTVVRKWMTNDSSALEMAKANTHDSDVDALSWYAGYFSDYHMDNSKDGLDTLRHLFVLQMGLGMRESSGQYCCGRDMSATNVESDTAEAGLFQMSWNASNSSDEMDKLMQEYASQPPQCALKIFEDGVSCSSSDWSCYGSGDGYEYQELAKHCPQFAVETTAIGLRNIRQHWGPINRYEVEIRSEADEMFKQVQDLVTSNVPVAGTSADVKIAKSGDVGVTVNKKPV